MNREIVTYRIRSSLNVCRTNVRGPSFQVCSCSDTKRYFQRVELLRAFDRFVRTMRRAIAMLRDLETRQDHSASRYSSYTVSLTRITKRQRFPRHDTTRHDTTLETFRFTWFIVIIRDSSRVRSSNSTDPNRPDRSTDRPTDYIASESVILLREQPFFTFIRGISIIRSIRVCVFAVECIVSIVFSRRRLVTFVKGRRRRSKPDEIQKGRIR